MFWVNENQPSQQQYKEFQQQEQENKEMGLKQLKKDEHSQFGKEEQNEYIVEEKDESLTLYDFERKNVENTELNN